MNAPDKPLATTFIVCGVVLARDGKYLLVQEKKSQVYGKWNLPSGRVDAGETLQEAAVREAKEECNFDVELGEQLLTLHTATDSPVLHAYAAKITGGTLAFPPDELLDARWFSLEEVVAMAERGELRNREYVLGAIQRASTQTAS